MYDEDAITYLDGCSSKRKRKSNERYKDKGTSERKRNVSGETSSFDASGKYTFVFLSC